MQLARIRSHQALQDSEERLIVAAESAEAGLWALDCRSGHFGLPKRLGRSLRYAPEEVVSIESLQRTVHS